MSEYEDAWYKLASLVTKVSQSDVEHFVCPSCGGALRIIWIPPPRHGALDISCLACPDRINTTQDEVPIWAEQSQRKTVITVPLG